MNFTIHSKDLLKSLNQLNFIIDSNPLLPILADFIFEVKEHEVIISCSDSETFIKTTVAVSENSVTLDDDSSNTFAVPSKILVETLRNIPDEFLTFEVNISDFKIKMLIKSGDFKIVGNDPEDFLDFPIIDAEADNGSVAIDPDILSSALKYTIFCTSSDELRPAMNGICIDLKENGECNFVGTDAHRLTLYKVSNLETTGEKTLILPNKSTKMIIKTLENADNPDVTFGFNDNYVAFTIAETHIVCRLIDETYPKYDTVIPENLDRKILFGKNETVAILRMMQAYADKSNDMIKITVENNKLELLARDKDFNTESKQELSCQYEGEKYSIGFNGKLLIELLKALPANEVMLKFTDNSKPGMLGVDDYPELLMLLMPIVMRDDNN